MTVQKVCFQGHSAPQSMVCFKNIVDELCIVFGPNITKKGLDNLTQMLPKLEVRSGLIVIRTPRHGSGP